LRNVVFQEYSKTDKDGVEITFIFDRKTEKDSIGYYFKYEVRV